MGGFIPSGAATQAEEAELPNLDFYPAIVPAEFRRAMDVDTTVSTDRLRLALQMSLMEVNRSLNDWAVAKIDEGIATLAETTYIEYGSGEDAVNHQVKLYQAAVFHLAKSRVIEHLRNFDSTGAGHGKADELSQPVDDFKREARRAVRAIMGQTGTVVELI